MAYNTASEFVSRENGIEARNIRVSSSLIARKLMVINSDASTVKELIDDLKNFDHPKYGKQNITASKYSIQISHAEVGAGVKVSWNDELPTTGSLMVMIGPKDNENGCK